jgi:hypothetical protein
MTPPLKILRLALALPLPSAGLVDLDRHRQRFHAAAIAGAAYRGGAEIIQADGDAGMGVERTGQGKRRKMVWDIERLLVNDAARPVILSSLAANCWQPYVRNFTPHDNSQYNLRSEEVWLDR